MCCCFRLVVCGSFLEAEYYDDRQPPEDRGQYGQYPQQGVFGAGGPAYGGAAPGGAAGPPIPVGTQMVGGYAGSPGGGAAAGGAGAGGGDPRGPNDIQQAAALSALAWAQTPPGSHQEGAPGSGMPLPGGGYVPQGYQSGGPYMAEIDAWKQANAAASSHAQDKYLAELQARMASARAALAGVSLDDGAGPSRGMPQEPAGAARAPPVFAAPIPAPIPASLPPANYSGSEYDVRQRAPRHSVDAQHEGTTVERHHQLLASYSRSAFDVSLLAQSLPWAPRHGCCVSCA